MSSLIKRFLLRFGIEVRRMKPKEQMPGSDDRPICNVRFFLEDIKARGFTPRGMIDVGAHRGHWTSMALSVFPRTPVILIEPQVEMKESLDAVIAENPNCEYIAAGAGRRDGELVQTIWDDYAGSSFLPTVEDAALRTGKQRKTPIITIDALLAGKRASFAPDLVKLDIQGFELEALSGGEKLFGKTEVFIVETGLFESMPAQPISREVISFMAQRGYEIYDVTEFLRRPRDGSLAGIDFVFVKAKGQFRQSNSWS